MTLAPVDIADRATRKADIKDLVIHDPTEVTAINGISVIDVGQGDCIGILNQDDKVFCYVDYGGFNYHPDAKSSKSNPSAYRMPATLNNSYVSVILTHWDKDHCWSAASKNIDARNCFWIVPRQYVAPSVARLAAKLTNAKRWPESVEDRSVEIAVGAKHRVTIRKCAKFSDDDENADRNLTGLAVTLVSKDEGGTEEVMLLPGDCPFDKIPNWESSLPIKALVAYHHGSHTHWKAGATDHAIRHWQPSSELVYSVGFNGIGTNCYGHPDTTNYDSNWNTNSQSTFDARARDHTSVIVRWS